MSASVVTSRDGKRGPPQRLEEVRETRGAGQQDHTEKAERAPDQHGREDDTAMILQKREKRDPQCEGFDPEKLAGQIEDRKSGASGDQQERHSSYSIRGPSRERQ